MGERAVELIQLDRALIGLLLDNAVSVYPGCSVRPDDRPILREIAKQTKSFYDRLLVPPEWGGFLVADAATRLVVGTCAFKGAPAPDSESGNTRVEIAYHTFPAHEGKGYGTAMAEELVRRAASSQRVATVVAHTLPQKNASARVLEKTGFEKTAEIVDPEDGPVWQWRRALS